MSYKCPKCQANFSRKWNRDRHLTGNKCKTSVKCDVCGKYFSRFQHLRRHLDSHAPRPANNRGYHDSKLKPGVKIPNLSQSTTRKRQFVNITYLTPAEPDIPEFLNNNEQAIQTYKEHYSAIRSFRMTGVQKIRHVYNYRLETGDVHEISDDLIQIFKNMRYRFKVNCSFGCILENIETGEFRYWHSSQNNYLVFSKPQQIQNESEYRSFIERVLDTDIDSIASINRENTKWKLRAITNLCLFFFRMLEIPIGCRRHVPLFIHKNRGLTNLHSRKGKICIFECIALFQKKPHPEHAAKELCEKFTGEPWEKFKGIRTKRLKQIEKFFNIRIHVYSLSKNEDGKVVANLYRQSTSATAYPVMFVNKYRKHFTYISNFSLYCKWLTCSICHGNFRTRRHCELLRHEKICDDKVKEFFPGGIYVPAKSIFQRLEQVGVHVPASLRMYPYRIFYDTEAMLKPINKESESGCLIHTSKHSLASLAYTSNVPGYTDVKCIVRHKGQSSFSFMKYCLELLTHISHEASELIITRLEPYLEQFEQIHQSYDRNTPRFKYLCKLRKDILSYIMQIPTLGFNSKSYDLPLFLSELAAYILKTDGKSPFILRRNNKYIGILTDHFRFLDITNYLSPGINYSGYLKAFDCTESKFYFPYEHFTSLSVLEETALPPHTAFYSSLKRANISLEEYNQCLQKWNERNMRNMKDYLKYYNTLDVRPAMEAIDKHLMLLQQLGIDPLKECFTISGLAFQYLFIRKYSPLALINRKELFYSLKQSLIGGPSIVFTRHAKVGQTFIKPHRYTNPRTVKSIQGFDANSLYLSVLLNRMPTGFMIIREASQNFSPRIISNQSFKATCWIEYIEKKRKVKFYHALYHGEARVSSQNIKVDGYHCSDSGAVSILQFMGCFYHAHDCKRNEGKDRNSPHPFRDPLTYDEVYQETLKRCETLRGEGYLLDVMWECEWDYLTENDQLAHAIKTERMSKKSNLGKMTTDTLLDNIVNENIFAIVECDISVPDHLREDFADFPPIFKHAAVDIESIGPKMRDYCLERDILSRPRKLLISSFHTQKQWFLSPMIKWYIEHGLIVHKIYRLLEFDKESPFLDIVNEITENRRRADKDPKYKTLGDTYKLIGNSIFGKSILAKEKLFSHFFCFEEDAERHVRSSRFRNLHEIGHDICEIEQARKAINQNMPITLGFAILNYAKLSLLKFYYDFIKKYIPDHRLSIMETDTDSLYLALSKQSLERCVSTCMMDNFLEEIREWMPIQACDEHFEEYCQSVKNIKQWQPHDCCIRKFKEESRTPGKWKLEASGDEMICLNSKTYILQNQSTASTKQSTKGVSKVQNNYCIQNFKTVLESQDSQSGINRGIKSDKHKDLVTYTQSRTALTYMYIKRKVLEDGVNTEPLEL